MRAEGIQPNVMNVNMMLETILIKQVPELDDVWKIYHEIYKEGIRPAGSTFAIMLSILLQRKAPQKMFKELWNDVAKLKAFPPIDTINRLLNYQIENPAFVRILLG